MRMCSFTSTFLTRRVSMTVPMSSTVEKALHNANRQANIWGKNYLGPIELLWGFAECISDDALQTTLQPLGIGEASLKTTILRSTRRSEAGKGYDAERKAPWDPASKKVFDEAIALAREQKSSQVELVHLLDALAMEGKGAKDILITIGYERKVAFAQKGAFILTGERRTLLPRVTELIENGNVESIIVVLKNA